MYNFFVTCIEIERKVEMILKLMHNDLICAIRADFDAKLSGYDLVNISLSYFQDIFKTLRYILLRPISPSSSTFAGPSSSSSLCGSELESKISSRCEVFNKA